MPTLLDLVEEPLDEITRAIQVRAKANWLLSIALRWNIGPRALLIDESPDPVCVISSSLPDVRVESVDRTSRRVYAPANTSVSPNTHGPESVLRSVMRSADARGCVRTLLSGLTCTGIKALRTDRVRCSAGRDHIAARILLVIDDPVDNGTAVRKKPTSGCFTVSTLPIFRHSRPIA